MGDIVLAKLPVGESNYDTWIRIMVDVIRHQCRTATRKRSTEILGLFGANLPLEAPNLGYDNFEYKCEDRCIDEPKWTAVLWPILSSKLLYFGGLLF